MNGGAGDDFLLGGTLVGGPGADEFAPGAPETTIENFSSSEGDRIDLVGYDWSEDNVRAMLDGSAGNVLDLSLLGTNDYGETIEGTITLGGGVQVSDLAVGDFLI